MLTIGDALEVVGIVCLTAACAVWLGWSLALLAAGIGLLYEAQCYTESFPRPQLPEFLRRHREKDTETDQDTQ
jgi:hypothetical protein